MRVYNRKQSKYINYFNVMKSMVFDIRIVAKLLFTL